MATRAETARAAKERKGENPKRARKEAQRKPRAKRVREHDAKLSSKSAPRTHEEKKATVVREDGSSRKSTRKTENGARLDVNLSLRATRETRSPDARARRAADRRARPRGAARPVG